MILFNLILFFIVPLLSAVPVKREYSPEHFRIVTLDHRPTVVVISFLEQPQRRQGAPEILHAGVVDVQRVELKHEEVIVLPVRMDALHGDGLWQLFHRRSEPLSRAGRRKGVRLHHGATENLTLRHLQLRQIFNFLRIVVHKDGMDVYPRRRRGDSYRARVHNYVL